MNAHRTPPPAFAAFGLAVLLSLGCESKPSEPAPVPKPEPVTNTPPKALDTPAQPDRHSGEPAGGKFTLAEATAGLTGKGKLIAEIQTEKGKLECELYEDKAPITVANFAGLARGLRPWKTPSGEWVKRAAYDGTTFHRVVKGFM